jgi:hypothetical protein
VCGNSSDRQLTGLQHNFKGKESIGEKELEQEVPKPTACSTEPTPSGEKFKRETNAKEKKSRLTNPA